jgi:serine/threonine protein kinase
MNRALASSRSRYTIVREIAAGGMATVYLGRLAGPGGFSRLVAIKRPHPHVARVPEFCAMLLDEGRLAASINHPNVVSTLDVVAENDDLFLVMEYVPGKTLAQIKRALRAQGARLEPAVACTIVHSVLLGLTAVHEARDEAGTPLGIVHRDISPQNILVGKDGVPRILDFGVAKAAGRLQVTRDGQLKGKIAYMAPEQMAGNATTRTDVFAAAVVLWEALAGRRLFAGDNDVEVFTKVLSSRIPPPSEDGAAGSALPAGVWADLDALVLRGLAREPSERFASAGEMAQAIEQAIERAPAAQLAELVARLDEGDVQAKELDAAAEDIVRSSVTVRDGGGSLPQDTWTKSGQNDLAVRLRAAESNTPAVSATSGPSSGLREGATSGSGRATKTALAVGLSLSLVAAVAGVAVRSIAVRSKPEAAPMAAPGGMSVTVTPPSPSEGPTPASVPTPSAAIVSAPSAPPINAADPAPAHSYPRSAPRIHPGSARPPVASSAVDVSHAIDQRH